jgi:hypothetical protein
VTDASSVVAAYFAAITAHDAEAVQACFTADAELVTAAGTYRGPAAIGGFYRDTAFRFKDLTPTPGPLLIDAPYVAVEIGLLMGGQHTPVADFFTIEGDHIRRLVITSDPPSRRPPTPTARPMPGATGFRITSG